MATVACLAQFKHSAASNHFPAMAQEVENQVAQVQQTWLAIDQRHHVDAESVLKLRVFVQVIQNDFRHFTAL